MLQKTQGIVLHSLKYKYFNYRRHLYRGVRTGFFSGAGVPFAQGCGEIGAVPAFVFGGA